MTSIDLEWLFPASRATSAIAELLISIGLVRTVTRVGYAADRERILAFG